MPDTDSKMMRSQQNKDVPETIEPDETQAVRGRSDSDALSRTAREAAKGEIKGDPSRGQDDVLAANEKVAGPSRIGGVRPAEAGPLAGKSRSRLGY